MKRTAAIAAIAASAALLAGCVVAPLPGHGYGHPAGVVYIAPSYPAPAAGFVWRHHTRHGWGWHHHRRGWHRGWH